VNLTDKEILELNELCNALVEGTISENQKRRLCAWLAASEAARRYYVRAMALSASLYAYASEMQVEALSPAPPPAKVSRLHLWWWFSPLLAAACVVLALAIFHRPALDNTPVASKTEDYVARLTGSKEAQWSDPVASVRPGEDLHKGQRLELARGFAEITFDSGAQVVLEGPASLDINSAWDATLRRGTLKANVPAEAMGFRISNPAVQVVDLGTEFTMIADASGGADVLVLKGMIEASSSNTGGERTIVLHEHQSRHFAASGVSKVSDPEQRFARIGQTVPLDHFLPATRYVHWGFDEDGGNILKADAFGLPLSAYDGRLEDVSNEVLETVRPEGRWQHGLRFNGHLYAHANVPGLSGNSPHTVAFWVKVPEDVRLPNAYAMVAWGMSSKKLGSHPVHIGWNRNPTEGTIGALRTDYGGGFALGATPLRDGRWHYVAVVFAPGDQPDTPVEVKQYVDGRFEGEGKPSPPGTEVSSKFSEESTTGVPDTVWLGCRLGANGPRKDRFRGEMDELCIADRSLGPREIVCLMKENKPPPTEVAATQP
jgi:ferric-dicitrate binding protein FerR (iron transport regulator)